MNVIIRATHAVNLAGFVIERRCRQSYTDNKIFYILVLQCHGKQSKKQWHSYVAKKGLSLIHQLHQGVCRLSLYSRKTSCIIDADLKRKSWKKNKEFSVI